MDAKVKAIVAHITPIGWIIALEVKIIPFGEYFQDWFRAL
jgi:hypothetical protein